MDVWKFWEEQQAEKKAFGGAMEFKRLDFELKNFDNEKLILEHIISSQRRDRGGDILYAGANSGGKGMVTDGGTISVLHSHGQHPVIGSEPIGKNLGLQVIEFKNYPAVLAKTQFFDDSTGRRVFEKIVKGFFPSSSVGWKPLVWEHKTEAYGEITRHVYEWLLLEYSVVGVGMQPDAVYPGEKQEQVLFKMMGQGPASNGKMTVHIPDSLIAKIFKETIPGVVKQAVREARGKVK